MSDRLILTGSIGFDAVTFEIFGALLNGACLHVVDRSTMLAPERFGNYLSSNRITILFLTTALFNQFAQADPEMFSGLHTLYVGGEALSPALINKVRHRCPNLSLYNIYGPTENTTFSTFTKSGTIFLSRSQSENRSAIQPRISLIKMADLRRSACPVSFVSAVTGLPKAI